MDMTVGGKVLRWDHWTFQQAAENAIFGRTTIKPHLDMTRCEARMFKFQSPMSDIDGRGAYDYAAAVITRGNHGVFATTTAVYAVDRDGDPIGVHGLDWPVLAEPRALVAGHGVTMSEVTYGFDTVCDVARGIHSNPHRKCILR